MKECLDRPVIGITYSPLDLEHFEQWRHVFHGFVAAGATPIAIDCTVEQQHVGALVRRLDGLVVSGGGDVDPALYGGDPADDLLRGVNPARDANERRAFEAALEVGTPVLAICRGFQLVNATLGGTLYVDLARDRPHSSIHRESTDALVGPLHKVEVKGGRLLSSWIGGDGVIAVNSEHHQGIRDLAEGLTPVAFAPDGLVEAFEASDRNLVGVQWHPEVLWAYVDSSAALLRGFVATCGGSDRPATNPSD